MKLIVFLFSSFVLISTCKISFSQISLNVMDELYLNRQPSPKIEAMGRGGVANNDGDFASYYNPALSGIGKGLKFNSSFSSPYYLADKSKFNYFGISYSDKKLGSIGFSRYHWTMGETFPLYDEMGNLTGETLEYNTSIYRLNYSRELVNDLFAGVNIGIPEMNNTGDTMTTPVTIDLGLLKRFNLVSLSKISHSVQAGISIQNITNAKFTFPGFDTKAYIPVILRAGGSHNMKIKGEGLIRGGNIFESLVHLEYESVTNESANKTFKIGAEFIISEIFALRAGYFNRKLDDGGFTNNANSQSEFTYGGGLKIPLHLIFGLKSPLSADVDYVSMKQPTFTNVITDWDNFHTIGININWMP